MNAKEKLIKLPKKEIMKITTEFLRGLPVGTEILLEDVDNVMSVQALCVRLKRMEGKVSYNVKTYPLDRKVRIKVLPYTTTR